MSITEVLTHVVQSQLELWKLQQLIECVRSESPGKQLARSNSQPGSAVVARYWREGLGDLQRNGCSKVPWSAAFICWSLRQSGVKLDEFPFSGGHHTYIRWAINNSKQGKVGKLYYGMRTETYRPQPGDIIAQWRKAEASEPDPIVSFDVQPDDFYSAHCDIVIEASPEKTVAVGGNVSNRVKESTFGAIDGLLRPKKALICILRLALDVGA